MDRVARRHPQTAYAGLQKSLHQEWAFVQSATPDIGMGFQLVEYALQDIFLHSLFQGGRAQIPGRYITGLLVKQAGISLPDPTWAAGANWAESCVILGHLVTSLCGTAKFRSGDHAFLMGVGRYKILWIHVEEAEAAMGEAQAAVSKPDA